MNYRHGFHAGNFADVFKHAVLCRVITHLLAKPAAFRVIDTHAGAGLYDLQGDEARRGAEWQGGIGRLHGAALDPGLADLLRPYLAIVEGLNPDGRLALYPGSPAIVQALLRDQDRLVACELEPRAAAALAQRFRADQRIRPVAIDGWTALAAYVPPKERRGLVLVDPPFEQPDEFEQLGERLVAAHRKWPTGGYLAWYPIKDRRGPDALARRLQRSAVPKILRVELTVGRLGAGERLVGNGLVLINPPWRLDEELSVLLPGLARLMSPTQTGGSRLDWLAREN